MAQKKTQAQVQRIYIASCLPQKTSLGNGVQYPAVMGWLNESLNQQAMISAGCMNESKADSEAVRYALKSAPYGAALEIMTDSEIVCAKLGEGYVVKDSALATLLLPTRARAYTFDGFRNKDVQGIRTLMQKRKLQVEFTYTPPGQNLARKWIEFELHQVKAVPC
jgi:hypothetical protein